jgi:MFS family permease
MASVSLPVFTALLLLLFPGSIPVILVAIFLLGLSVGGEYDAIIYLSTRYFGMRNFGTLFGFVAAALLAGVGLGPLIASHLYDQTGSYQSFLLLAIPAGALCAVLIGTLGRYPDHEAAPAAM